MTELHLRTLRLLADNPALSQRTIAKKLRLSLGKANYIINALREKGYIKMKRFRNSKSKASYMYVLTPAGIRMRIEMTAQFIKIKSAEYRTLLREVGELEKEMERFGQSKDAERR